MVPIEYDEQGNVLDGHRIELCEELGITAWPRLIRHGLSEQQKRQHARRLNLARRHLNAEQRRALIAEELREQPVLATAPSRRFQYRRKNQSVTVRDQMRQW